jgi:hypothetical protein
MPTDKGPENELAPMQARSNAYSRSNALTVELVPNVGAEETADFYSESLEVEGDIRNVLFEPQDERVQLHALVSVLSDRFYDWVELNRLDIEIQRRVLLRFIDECISRQKD